MRRRPPLAAGDLLYSRSARSLLMVLSAVALATGIGNVLTQVWYSGYHRIDNAIEWNLTLLLNVYFLATALIRCEPEMKG